MTVGTPHLTSEVTNIRSSTGREGGVSERRVSKMDEYDERERETVIGQEVKC